MKKNITPYVLVLVCLFALAVGVRFWNYAEFPPAGESADELAWTMVGASLLQTGTPAAWSYFEYTDPQYSPVHGFSLPLVQPYLDHPPLFGFIPGFVQFLSGRQWFDLVSLAEIRFPVVVLGCINVVLFWFVTRKLFIEKFWRVVSVTLFATMPIIVFSSRVIVAEQLLITWLLLGLWLILTNPTNRLRSLLILSVGFLLVCTKISGLVIGVGLVGYAVALKRRRDAALLLLGLVLGGIGFLTYAYAYDWQLFWHIQSQQQTWRSPGLLSVFMGLLFRPELVNSVFFDGVYLSGFIAWLATHIRTNESNKWQGFSILLGIFCAFIFYAAGETTLNQLHGTRGGSLYGWYWYPMLPLFALLITRFFERTVAASQHIAAIILLAVLGVPAIRLSYFVLAGRLPTEYLMPKFLYVLIFCMFGLGLLVGHKTPKAVVAIGMSLLVFCYIVILFGMNSTLYWADGSYWNQL